MSKPRNLTDYEKAVIDVAARIYMDDYRRHLKNPSPEGWGPTEQAETAACKATDFINSALEMIQRWERDESSAPLPAE